MQRFLLLSLLQSESIIIDPFEVLKNQNKPITLHPKSDDERKFQKEMKFELRLKFRFGSVRIAEAEAEWKTATKWQQLFKSNEESPYCILSYTTIQHWQSTAVEMQCIRISKRNDRRTVSNLFSNRGWFLAIQIHTRQWTTCKVIAQYRTAQYNHQQNAVKGRIRRWDTLYT